MSSVVPLSPTRSVDLRLDSPPEVVSLGIGIHGVRDRVERWLLPELWAVHVYDYAAELEVAGITHHLRPGTMTVIPAGWPMEFRMTGPSEHVFAHLRMPTTGPATTIPLSQDLGDAATMVRTRMRRAATLTDPAHRAAELWSILWAAARLVPLAPGGEDRHPAVAAAMDHIEANLSGVLRVPDVADHALVSISHLNRLFRAAHGAGVTEVIRRRRMERAAHLLTETTQPVTSIAAAVGIPDLQAFNKLCRIWFGRSPREVRRDRGSSPRRGG